MFQKRKPIGLGRLLLILLVVAGISNATSEADEISTIEDLTPEARKKFEKLREELREASTLTEKAKQRAYAENPLLLVAKEKIEQSRKLENEAGQEYRKVRQFLNSKGKETRQQYQKWQQLYGEVLDYESVKVQSQDPQLQPFFSWFAKMLIEGLRERNVSKDRCISNDRSKAENLVKSGRYGRILRLRKDHKNADINNAANIKALIRDDLPPKDVEITSQRAMELYMLILKRNADQSLAKLVELEKKLESPPPECLQQYAVKKNLAGGLFNICDTYYRMKMPPYVADAKKEAKKRKNELLPQLNKIWPGWREAEQRE